MPTIFHDKAIELAVEINEASREKYASTPNDIVHDALFVLSHDAICVHRSIGILVDAGWSGPGAALLRTLLDLNVSALAIVNSATPHMAAFRYLYSGFRRHSRDVAIPSQARRQMRAQLRTRIRALPKHFRVAALEVLKDKDRLYWFAPEWQKPSDVIKQFARPELAWTYAQASGAAHGAFLGMRLFRDDPDKIDINPRPFGPKAASLDLASCRLLLEIAWIRSSAEVLAMEGKIQEVQRDIADAVKRLPVL